MAAKKHWFLRLADYERPWVGRLGLALLLVLWALVSLAGFASGIAVGLIFAFAGATSVVGEIWLEQKGERLAWVAFAWHTAWQIAAGALLIGIALATDGWSALLPGLIGAWLILFRIAIAAVLFRAR